MKFPLLFSVSFLITIHSAEFHVYEETLGKIKATAPADVQAKAVLDLIRRLIPHRAVSFNVKIDPGLKFPGINGDGFKIVKSGEILITATTGVAAATGFNYYLKYYCKCHVSWDSVQLNLPVNLPDVNVTIPLNDRFRYYQNVCTTSYSFVWWNWTQWEKHIDWMALNSFNLVLAFNAQEAIWDRVYREFNLTKAEIDQHFAGPAFLAWQRMGNIRGWGGPLSSGWHTRQIELQKRIVGRMTDLGIIPVLPAFAGHIPRAFERLYPDAKMKKVGTWNRFNDTYCCPYFLEPSDPLFKTIGKRFLQTQISMFGTNHVYSGDSFNENLPSSMDVTYLANVSRTIYESITSVDKDAIWIIQNWLFVHDYIVWTPDRVKALLTSVPKGRLVILDLQSEQFPQYYRLKQYFGLPYIWCMLHDFGGTLGIFGSSSIINEQPAIVRNESGSTMIGVGVTPEGINQNYPIYELMAEMAWRNRPTNLTSWIEDYCERRYGLDDARAKNAWRILFQTIYDFKGLHRIRGKYVITRTPSLTLSTWRWYNVRDLFQAWTSLIDASDRLGNSPGYLHDLVDVTRQVLQLVADSYYKSIIEAYKTKDIELFSSRSVSFLEIFEDLESILNTNGDFLLGRWILDAREAATAGAEEEADQFEYNARNQITLWGPNGEITNYANKQWAGVVGDFFAPRWTTFLAYLKEILENNENFNQSLIKKRMFTEIERPFTLSKRKYPTEARGNAVVIAKTLHQKYTPLFIQ